MIVDSLGPGREKRVSVVIVNYNSGPYLVACVASAVVQASEVLVVDNGSTDSSIRHCTDRWSGDTRVHIIRNNANLGFAKACNIGAAQASGDFLLFLNPDCVLAESAISELQAAFYLSPRVGMVGGLLLNSDGSEQRGGRRAVPTPWRTFVRGFGLTRLSKRWPTLFFDFHLEGQPLPDRAIEVEAISGACMLVSRQAVDDVGLWDEGYFLHCEDLDWCMRFREKAWKIMFVPTTRISHALGASSKSRPVFVEWHKHRGMVRFYRKFFSQKYPWLLMWLIVAGVWMRFTAVVAYHLVRKTVLNRGGNA